MNVQTQICAWKFQNPFCKISIQTSNKYQHRTNYGAVEQNQWNKWLHWLVFRLNVLTAQISLIFSCILYLSVCIFQPLKSPLHRMRILNRFFLDSSMQLKILIKAIHLYSLIISLDQRYIVAIHTIFCYLLKLITCSFWQHKMQ